MRSEPSWTPVGASLGLSFEEGAPERSGEGFSRELVERARQLDLGVEHVFLAWEISRLAEGLSERERGALIVIVLALLAMQGEGSTRLSVGGGGRAGGASRLIDVLCEGDDGRLAVRELLDTIGGVAARATSGADERDDSHDKRGLAAVIGVPGDYRPLLVDDGCLYIQRLHVLEVRVARALSRLLAGERGSGAMASAATAQEGTTAPGRMEGQPSWTPPSDEEVKAALGDVLARPSIHGGVEVRLTAEQERAVDTALRGRITVISGRPGSGKTSIVAAILRVLGRLGDTPMEAVALAAPTGKAADRMRQSLASQLAAIERPSDEDCALIAECPSSATLHRLLGYMPNGDRFRYDEHNPLSERLVIVDESSMVDLSLMDRLLRALRPDVRLILLGDADQLPSVDTGAVLRDLCRAEAAAQAGRSVLLTESFRARAEDPAGSAILTVAAAINEGRVHDLSASADGGSHQPPRGEGSPPLVRRESAGDLGFMGVELLAPPSGRDMEAFFERWISELQTSMPDLDQRLSRAHRLENEGFSEETGEALLVLLRHFERFRILCATRVPLNGTGADAVNEWFHARMAMRRSGGFRGRGPGFLVGEPVMVNRNDHVRRLYNGDSGLVVWVTRGTPAGEDGGAEPMAVFQRAGGVAAYPLEALRGRLELAWATTVHKAQGSEYENVAVILPEPDVRTLTRELLYTAVTRAKRSVVIVGTLERLSAGSARVMGRSSGLSGRLVLPGRG